MEEFVFERVRSILNSLYSGNCSSFARSIGLAQKTLHNQLSGLRGLSLQTILAILSSNELISAEWLLRGEGEMIKASTVQMNATDLTYYTRLLKIKQDRIEELEAELARVKSIAV